MAAQSLFILLSSSLTYRAPCNPFDTFLCRDLSFLCHFSFYLNYFPLLSLSFPFFLSLPLSSPLFRSFPFPSLPYSLFLAYTFFCRFWPFLTFPFAFIFSSQTFFLPFLCTSSALSLPFLSFINSLYLFFVFFSLLFLSLFLSSLFMFTPTATGHSAEVTAAAAIWAGFFNARWRLLRRLTDPL